MNFRDTGLDLTASLKRIAWAYGCAKKGSEQEARLRDLLLTKLDAERHANDDGGLAHAGKAPF